MPPTQIITNLGTVMASFQGFHNPDLPYKKLNIVVDDKGSSYLCISDTIEGVPLTDRQHWSFLAKGAYQYWVEAGGIGTVDDFLTWLRSPSNVYIGNGPPPQGHTVWIDPNAGTALQTAVIRFNDAAILATQAANQAIQETNNVQQAKTDLIQSVLSKLNDVDAVLIEVDSAIEDCALVTSIAQQSIQDANLATHNANTARDAANSATTSANTAAALANEVATHPPIIINNTWHYWNPEIDEYVDSTLPATPYEHYLQNTTDNPPKSEEVWSLWSVTQGEFALEQGNFAKTQGEFAQLVGETYDSKKADKTELAKTQSEVTNLEYLLQNANLNNEARATVIDYTTIPLPKTAANGSCDVKLEGQSAENLVVNGDFRNGTTGWIADIGYSISVINGSLIATVTSLNAASRIGTLSLNFPNTTDKYYIVHQIKAKYANSTFYSFRGTGTTNTVTSQIIANQLVKVSITTTATSSGAGRLFVYHSTGTNYQIGDTIELGKVRLINLTATFGAGNEPNLATCDKIFATYFEGTKHAIGVGRYRSVLGTTVSKMYFNAGLLRSNQAVRDSIERAANGYQLVKRIGVATLSPHYSNNFEGTPALDVVRGTETSTFQLNTTTPISGTKDARVIVSSVGASNSRPLCYLPNVLATVALTYYKVTFKYKVNSGNCIFTGVYFGGGGTVQSPLPATLIGSGVYTTIIQASQTRTNYLGLSFDGTQLFDAQLDDWTVEIVNLNGTPATGLMSFTELGSNIHYTLATPTSTPLNTAGVLMSNPQGTIYREYALADAGYYNNGIGFIDEDYPIASLETLEIVDSDNNAVILNPATAVIASDGLSFTHPDLTNGDIVFFEYQFSKERVEGKTTVDFYTINKDTIFNVTESIPLESGFYTSTTARAAVQVGARKKGMILTYETSSGVWYTERFKGASTSTWTTEGDWEIVPSKKYVDDQDALKLDKSSVKSALGQSITDVVAQKTITDELALKETILDVKAIVPAIQLNKRILADSGIVPNLSLLAKYFAENIQSNPANRFLYFPQAGIKERTSGVNKYANKVYDLDASPSDAVQATENVQPFVGGYIPPNEFRSLKLVQGQTQTGRINYNLVTLAPTSSFTLKIILKPNNFGGRINFGNNYIAINNNGTILNNGGANILNSTGVVEIGKVAIIEFHYENGLGLIKINNNPTTTIPFLSTASSTFTFISYDPAFPFDGEIFYINLLDGRQSEADSQREYNFLRAYFPEISTIPIQYQQWQTSNLEVTTDGAGNRIGEVQLNTTGAELITNGSFDTDTGWVKGVNATSGNNWKIEGGVAVYTSLATTGTPTVLYQNIQLVAGRKYRIEFTNVGTARIGIIPASANPEVLTYFTYTSGTYSFIVTPSQDLTSIGVGASQISGSFTLDNFSIKEVGWSDSTDIYNARIAAGDSVAVATRAASMWCYPDNDPIKGAVYGKIYNGYAYDQLGINPIRGYHPSRGTEVEQLRTALGDTLIAGGKIKVAGLTYWNTPNTGGTNESGLSIIATGRRAVDGTFANIGTNGYIRTESTVYITQNDNTTLSAVGSLAKGYGASIRLIKNEPFIPDRGVIRASSTANIASTALQIPIPFGCFIESIRIYNKQAATNLTSVSATQNNTAGASLGTLITGKTVNAATSSVFPCTQLDMLSQVTDGTVRVIGTGNAGDGIDVEVIFRKSGY